MKITVMGLGYIGLPTAITLAEAGFEVCGFDVNKKTIETLQGGHIHIVEPGLQEAFEKAVAHGHLHFSDTLGKSDVFYISVPTPFYKDETGSHRADLKFVESAGRMAGKVLEAPNLVILESTVPPHTSEMLARVLSEESGIPMEKIHVAHCPERVIPGNMMYELKNNDRIVGARTPEAAEMAASIYEKVLDKGVVHKTDDLTAEMCKLTENTFRDVNIAYANELSVICDKMGIDVFEHQARQLPSARQYPDPGRRRRRPLHRGRPVVHLRAVPGGGQGHPRCPRAQREQAGLCCRQGRFRDEEGHGYGRRARPVLQAGR